MFVPAGAPINVSKNKHVYQLVAPCVCMCVFASQGLGCLYVCTSECLFPRSLVCVCVGEPRSVCLPWCWSLSLSSVLWRVFALSSPL